MKKRVFVFDETIINTNQIINLKDEYSHIRGYHGCRVLNLDDYYENGIVPINKNETLRRALYLLKNDRISENEIVKVFNSHWMRLTETHKYVWFTLTKSELIDYCGHYLIYGSEFICGIAAELRCQDSLKKGIPTIFHCDIPIEKIPSGYLEDLNDRIKTGDGYNCGFKVIGAISKDEVVKCEHPRKILDPLNGYMPYYCR
ncbi:hypothetical protein Desdi_1400 [Desulfitobacterium dichloroeliminans LMG P-21439]|uniref:Uncharacterized protein n=1 Tax=Desulfitobacterium dichloroeliminans (strain LMG P-21439 / DCA1) TaxID=871963 RepID=L0F7G5_DESDL|nr:hypothetical protein [Desulfitobacterium dichloroeliminans]AGA68903.1 hypothetical protein Desdi_1400 [Desulfitobacterium dichloroeliminans LMG P-21439]